MHPTKGCIHFILYYYFIVTTFFQKLTTISTITIPVGNAAIIATDWILTNEVSVKINANGNNTNTTAQNPRINLLGSSEINKLLYEYLEITIVIESKTVE